MGYGGRRSRRRYGRKRGRRVRRARTSLAKKAFRLAKRLANHSEETKYFRRGLQSDVVGGAIAGKFAVWDQLTQVLSTDAILFNTGVGTTMQYITGNKYYHKRTQIRWEIHMDSPNNEEETCNFTVAVLSFKRDADASVILDGGSDYLSMARFTDVYQGQAFFDRRMVNIHYYKHFTLTMGGTSPGTSGQMLKRGVFKKSLNKMFRRPYGDGGTGLPAFPVDVQDRLFFCVITDNVSADLENPRINYSIVNTIKDTDIKNSAYL